MAKAYLGRYYGDQVVIEYYDIAQDGMETRFREFIAQAPAGYLLYPLLFVEGQIKGVGNVEYFTIFEAARQALEAKRAFQGPVLG